MHQKILNQPQVLKEQYIILIGSKSQRVTIGEDAQSNTLRKKTITWFDGQPMRMSHAFNDIMRIYFSICMHFDAFRSVFNGAKAYLGIVV